MSPKKTVKRSFKHAKWFKVFTAGLWQDHPTFCMVLGICSMLAVTNRMNNAIAMGLGVTFCTAFSSLFISIFRNVIPARVRMLAYMVIIATFVICVDRFLKAYFPPISEELGPYVGLIITNCILMGRAEAYAIKNGPLLSVLDGLGCGIGYTFMLMLMALVRETSGFGTLLGYRVMPGHWTNWVVMTIAPGAFFLLGVYLWIFRTIAKKTEA
ncbi:MAG: NADH:ubiquinone reductase (Na(+)-transporting) subunit D [Candidatus Sungbacteria bacterium RIFCSPLOWO2_12_FULL_41_11]|uniref:NADH:ubiquinone reductase (Na(+)-transporting) subunit D n=1 Tax=Candidatus Sungbacteria bacterium RIFCSPLOWO2_12_FULL_41_11 TaxID=1802286 RepID=A0A1G2LSA9_9BACT|nr:MAG: NADH:ubiquinone reductase (Na(+)-transporting) subunit D [Candidatus Sungbacteria bacterium RIFCSPLOWO2_12_FULL_41_11]